jgi:hypothetical protein
MKRKWLIISTIFVILALLLWRTNHAQSQNPQITPIPYSQDEVQHLESMLSQEGLDTAARASLEEKLAIARGMTSDQSLEINDPAIQAAASLPTPLPGGDPPFRSGIFDGDEGLFRPEIAIITNYWQGRLEDGYVQVFAGADGGDLQQALLIVLRISKDRMTVGTDFYEAPANHGSLHIVSEQDLRIVLLSKDGTSFVFDLTKGAFLNNK